MAKMTTDEMIDAFKEMTLSELSELVDKFEETFDVSAQAPVAVAGAGAGGAGGEGDGDEQEQDVFDVVITEIGDKKIQVIKEVRGLTNLGLKEAKELVESAPGTVIESVGREEADEAKGQLEEAGATVELQ